MPPDDGLSSKLERLLQEYNSKLSSLELRLPPVETPQGETKVVLKNYFPDEPAPPARPPESSAPAAQPPSAAGLKIIERAPIKTAPSLPRRSAQARPPVDLRRLQLAARPILLGAALLAAIALVLAALRASGDLLNRPHRFFALKGEDLAGLASDGTDLYAFDAANGRVESVSSGGQAREAGTLAGGPVAGLARAENGKFWTSAQDQGSLYEHDDGVGRPIRKSYSYPNRRFGAIAFSGDYLWVVDSKTNSIDQYLISRSLLGASLTPISQFSLAPESARAAGLSISEGLVWICDAARRRVLRYRAQNQLLEPVDWADLGDWIDAGGRITGMTLTDGELWVLTAWPPGLHKLPLKKLSWIRFKS